MKKFVFMILLLFCFFSEYEAKAVVKVHAFTSSNQHFGGGTVDPYTLKYESVQIHCDELACSLRCPTETTEAWGKTCTWANADWCLGCINDG